MIIEAYTHKAAKNHIIDDSYIIKYFYSSNNKRIIKSKLNNIPKDILSYLNKRYKDSTSVEETIQRIHNNIDVHPVCPICSNYVKYVGGTRFFLKTCGNSDCSKKLNVQNGSSTVMEKYGVSNIAKTEEVRNKLSLIRKK